MNGNLRTHLSLINPTIIGAVMNSSIMYRAIARRVNMQSSRISLRPEPETYNKREIKYNALLAR
jgi:hypothetical protein